MGTPAMSLTGFSNKAFQQLQILEERVRFSGARLPELSPREFRTVIKCRIDGLNVLFQLQEAGEIIDQIFLTELPGCEPWVTGVLNYRGNLLPVYHVSSFFNRKTQRRANPSDQVIVVEHGAMLCGLIPDELCGMQKIFQEDELTMTGGQEADPKPLMKFMDASLRLADQTWYQLDLLELARFLFQKNPALRMNEPNQA